MTSIAFIVGFAYSFAFTSALCAFNTIEVVFFVLGATDFWCSLSNFLTAFANFFAAAFVSLFAFLFAFSFTSLLF